MERGVHGAEDVDGETRIGKAKTSEAREASDGEGKLKSHVPMSEVRSRCPRNRSSPRRLALCFGLRNTTTPLWGVFNGYQSYNVY